jgi:tetratricopeptide (TPR) repeat protein
VAGCSTGVRGPAASLRQAGTRATRVGGRGTEATEPPCERPSDAESVRTTRRQDTRGHTHDRSGEAPQIAASCVAYALPRPQTRFLEGDRTAESITRALGDERRLGRISLALANTLWITGDHAAAIVAASQALEIGQRLGDIATHATAVLRLGAIHYTLGEYDTAAVYLRQGLQLTGGEWLRERFGMASTASVVARHWLAWPLAERGKFSEELGEVARPSPARDRGVGVASSR